MLFKNTSFLSKSDVKLPRTWFLSNTLKMEQNRRSESNPFFFPGFNIEPFNLCRFYITVKKNPIGKIYFPNKITKMASLGKNSAFPTTLRFFWE